MLFRSDEEEEAREADDHQLGTEQLGPLDHLGERGQIGDVPGFAVGDREPAERVVDRLAVRLLALPERGILRPDALDRALLLQSVEGVFEGAGTGSGSELQLQATPTALCFSPSVFISES